jgi:hypothetical protein
MRRLAKLVYVAGFLLLVLSSPIMGAEAPSPFSVGVRGVVDYVPVWGPACAFAHAGGEIFGRAGLGFVAVQASVGQTVGISCDATGVGYAQLGLVTNTSPLYAGVLAHVWLWPTFRVTWFCPTVGLQLSFSRVSLLVEAQVALPEGQWFSPGAVWGFWFAAGLQVSL